MQRAVVWLEPDGTCQVFLLGSYVQSIAYRLMRRGQKNFGTHANRLRRVNMKSRALIRYFSVDHKIHFRD